MFEISWADPTRETVGQHKAREETVRISKVNNSQGESQGTALSKPSNGDKKRLSKNGPSKTGDSKQQMHILFGNTTTLSKLSAFSEWASRSSISSTSSGSTIDFYRQSGFAEALNPASFVFEGTEITVSAQERSGCDEETGVSVHISANGTSPIELYNTPSTSTKRPPSYQLFDNPKPIKRTSKITKMAKGLILQANKFPTWRAPDEWNCPPEKEPTSPKQFRIMQTEHIPKTPSSKVKDLPSQMTYVQRSIRMKELASTKVMLGHLKKDLTEATNTSLYKELELEKQLWLLTALRSLNKTRTTGDGISTQKDDLATEPPESETGKILSLYENQASSSFLSALAPSADMHHISTSPLSPEFYPNVRPIVVPNPTSSLPYASSIFNSIHAFSLAQSLPSSSIPSILKECHRTLIGPSSTDSQTGKLHLTIMNPSPLPATMGPLLGAWLDNHLIMNLEKEFRCINPVRLFPVWLADARLNGEGSKIVSTTFKVVSQMNSDVPLDEEDINNVDRVELKSMVGRMLWKDIWGEFVKGQKRWWWEDDAVIAECTKYGTCWEYSIIEATKER